MSHPSHVALDQLKIDHSNIRQAGAGAEPVYVATIEHMGVIEPLIVRPNGTGYLVMQGGKRLASLFVMKERGLSARGLKVTGAYPVPVIIREDVKTAADAREISLVTAICHMPVHPVDQFEAFAALADKKGGGLSVDEIARRFGQPKRLIEQRLALGRLSPTIRTAFRDGAIGVEIAQAFTLAVDHKQQDRVFESMRKSGELRWGNAAGNVKRAIAGKDGQLGGAELIFVGAEAYEKAGGKVTVDLFNQAHSIVNDPTLLQKLVGEKIGAVCTDLVTNQGWKWARPDSEIKDRWRYSSLNKKGKPTEEETAEITRLTSLLAAIEDGDNAAALKLGATPDQLEDDDDDIREELERLNNTAESRAFTDKDKTKSGCAVGITQKGQLLITYGLIEPERQSSSSSTGASSRSSTKAEPAKKAPAAISNTLKKELKWWLANATQIAIVKDKYKDERAVLLAKLIAGKIEDNGRNAWGYMPVFSDKEMAALRDQATPAVMKAALAEAFDAQRYFAGIPASFRLRALAEMGHDGAAPKKAAETIGLCKKLAASTSWLPAELRWAHYEGPAGKAKPTAKAKPKKKAA